MRREGGGGAHAGRAVRPGRTPPARAVLRGAGGVTDAWPGRPFPLGAEWDGEGTNFSLFSDDADRVQLCLFETDGNETQIEMTERTALTWHCYLPDVGPGQRYGYRVHGPYRPQEGLRFNPAKLLIAPYAKAIEGTVPWGEEARGLPYLPPGDEDAGLEP